MSDKKTPTSSPAGGKPKTGSGGIRKGGAIIRDGGRTTIGNSSSNPSPGGRPDTGSSTKRTKG